MGWQQRGVVWVNPVIGAEVRPSETRDAPQERWFYTVRSSLDPRTLWRGWAPSPEKAMLRAEEDRFSDAVARPHNPLTAEM